MALHLLDGTAVEVDCSEVDRAVIGDRISCFLKLVTAPHMVRHRQVVARLARTIQPYPTHAIALRMSAGRLFGAGGAWRPARGVSRIAPKNGESG